MKQDIKKEYEGLKDLLYIKIMSEYKLLKTLQEIKTIAEHEIKELTDSAINGGRYLEILDLITKAESEG